MDDKPLISCQKCSSDDIMIVADPKTGQPHKSLGHYLAVCRNCGQRCAVNEAQGAAILAARPIDDALPADHACPKCEYNLKGRRVGDRCPECGTILTTTRTLPFSAAREPFTVWNWLALAFLGALAATYFATGNMTKKGRVATFLIVASSGFIGYGIKGIVTDRIKFWRVDYEFKGLWATSVGVLYILVGAGMLALGVLVLFDIFK